MSEVVIEAVIPSDAFDLGQALQDHTSLEMELVRFVPTSDGFVPYIRVQAEDRGAFESSLEDDGRIASFAHQNSEGKKHLYSIDWADEFGGLLESIRGHDVYIRRAVGTESVWRFWLFSPNHESVSEFSAAIRDQDIPLDVHRIKQAEAPVTVHGMTERQRKVVSRAFELGYFETPKQSTLEPIAREMGISPQAVSGLLNRGLNNLLRNTLLSR